MHCKNEWNEWMNEWTNKFHSIWVKIVYSDNYSLYLLTPFVIQKDVPYDLLFAKVDWSNYILIVICLFPGQ